MAVCQKQCIRLLVGAVTLAISLLGPDLARADSILFTGTGAGADGVTLNASALFDISGTTLTITLSNTGDTSGSSQDAPANALTGVFFDLLGATLTPVSATIAAGSLLQGNLCNPGPCTASTTNVGGEFRHAAGSFPSPHVGAHGIASAGYIGSPPNFNGPNLDEPDSPDGSNFSIIAPVTLANPFVPNGGMVEPIIEGSVQFVMSIAADRQLTRADLSHVSFQYGTDFTEPNFPRPGEPVPEPLGAVLTLSGIAVAVRRVSQRRDRSGVNQTTYLIATDNGREANPALRPFSKRRERRLRLCVGGRNSD